MLRRRRARRSVQPPFPDFDCLTLAIITGDMYVGERLTECQASCWSHSRPGGGAVPAALWHSGSTWKFNCGPSETLHTFARKS